MIQHRLLFLSAGVAARIGVSIAVQKRVQASGAAPVTARRATAMTLRGAIARPAVLAPPQLVEQPR